MEISEDLNHKSFDLTITTKTQRDYNDEDEYYCK